MKDKFKRCPVQPLPGAGILCQSCQRRIVIEPCRERSTGKPICIPLYKPIKQLVNRDWQEIYPILERTTPGGKPIQNDLLRENDLDTEFREACNLYLSEFSSESHIPNEPART